ncbi:Wall-associated receptor kinase [Theobroma cacao]|nr:Wall-associated receptor kinase [Theobroma cacao]
MHCRRFLPSLFPLSFFLVLLVIVKIPQSLGNPDGYSACRDPRFECGGISVGYPFSGDGIPTGCGHPGLQLHCEESIATIEILDVRYQVLRIGEDNQTPQIARKDFMTNFCHPQFESSAFDSTLFNIFPGYTNVALFYDCTSAIPYNIGSYDCNGSHKNVSIIPSAFIREVCARNITVPISETSLPRIANSASLLEEALKTGFEVELNVSLKVDSKACQKCRGTGGTCGFDFQNHTNCYCLKDPGLSLKECPPPPPSQANTAEQVPGCKLHRERRSLTMLKGLSNPAELGSGK